MFTLGELKVPLLNCCCGNTLLDEFGVNDGEKFTLGELKVLVLKCCFGEPIFNLLMSIFIYLKNC